MIRTAILACFGLLAVIANVGCVGQRIAVQAQVDAMRAEQMELEDRYYRLESNYRKAQRELERLRQDDGDADDRLDEGDSSSEGAAEDQVSRLELSGDRDSRQVSRAVPSNTLRSDPEPTGLPGDSTDETLPTTHDDEAPWIEPMTRATSRPIRDWRVTHLIINPLLTKGRNIDGRYGDDGISLVVEPRNADDQYVPLAGALTVSLIDPEEVGEEQRIGLWQLTEEEVEPRVYQAEDGGQGIQLKLPWQTRVPRHRRLLVFVRYETPEGEQLETSNEVSILLPQAGITSWSARETPLMTVGHEEPEHLVGGATARQAFAPAPDSTGASSEAPVGQPAPHVARPRWSPYR